jgi:hypothetical protein
VGEEEAFEDAFDGLFFVVGEALGGFELEAQLEAGSGRSSGEDATKRADGDRGANGGNEEQPGQAVWLCAARL